MNESLKAILVLAVIILCVVVGFGWILPTPHEVRRDPAFWWSLRILPLPGALLLAIPLLRERLFKEKVPDFLDTIAGPRFNRENLDLMPIPIEKAGHCRFLIFFQNARANRCAARILIRPQASFFTMSRDPALIIAAEIDCAGGAFGSLEVPIAVPPEYQGKDVWFEVFAHVTYPDGRGQRLRRDRGLRVGKLPSAMRSSAFHVFRAAAAVTGTLVISRPARFCVHLPTSVTPFAAPLPQPQQTTLWKPGQPYLDVLGRTVGLTRPS